MFSFIKMEYSYLPVHVQEKECSKTKNLMKQQVTSGGRSGRGVIPCGVGYVQHNNQIIPYDKNSDIVKKSMLLDADRPGYVPPQGNIRPHIRIGNVYRIS